MRLWTVQPWRIYEKIKKEGMYRCEDSFIDPYFKQAYDWLVKRMIQKIGVPPEGVEYPVWAIHTWYGKHAKPDFRKLRWEWGGKGDVYACIEIDIPGNTVVLSDYNAWHFVLNRFPLTKTEAEFDNLSNTYDKLSLKEKRMFMKQSWEDIFDVEPLNDDWISKGEYVQATFWELRKEQIIDVRRFVAAGK